MMRQPYQLNKLISIIHRHGQRFFDRELFEGVKSGQQFFLVRIYENQGISMQELAGLGYFDNGTVTRAVQQLIDKEYIIKETDAKDRRLCHLYTTPKALPQVEEVYEVGRHWNEILMDGLTEQEKEQAAKLLGKMAENAYQSIKNKKVY